MNSDSIFGIIRTLLAIGGVIASMFAVYFFQTKELYWKGVSLPHAFFYVAVALCAVAGILGILEIVFKVKFI